QNSPPPTPLELVHALWTMEGALASETEKPNSAVLIDACRKALKHPSPAVRRSAALALPRDPRSMSPLVESKVLRDDDVQVRLAALMAVANFAPDGGAVPTLCSMM